MAGVPSDGRHETCDITLRGPDLIVEVGLVALIGVVLVIISVMLVVHVLGRIPCVSLGPHSVVFIHALGLGQFVDFGTCKAGEELFGKRMRDGLAYMRRKEQESVMQTISGRRWAVGWQYTFSALSVLEELHAFKGSGAADEFVRELGFVSLVAVDLLVSITAIVCCFLVSRVVIASVYKVASLMPVMRTTHRTNPSCVCGREEGFLFFQGEERYDCHRRSSNEWFSRTRSKTDSRIMKKSTQW